MSAEAYASEKPRSSETSLHGPAGRTIRSDVLDALVTWSGEAIVGVLPLLTHLFAKQVFPLDESQEQGFQAEVCIVAVVVAGLSMLAVLPLGANSRSIRITRFTFWIFLCTLLSLIFGTLLYSLTLARTDTRITAWAWAILVLALAGSLSLAIEQELLKGAARPVSPGSTREHEEA